MTIRKKIKDVLKSKYLTLSILKDRGLSVSLINELEHKAIDLDKLHLPTCEKLLRVYNALHALKQRRHNERGIAGVKDVKDKLRNPWEYAIYYPDGHLKVTRRIQPEVHRLSYQEFKIVTPYSLDKCHHITYILIKRHDIWYLATYPNQVLKQWLKELAKRFSKHQMFQIKKYLRYLMTKYQVSELPSGNCYIQILNRSIQDAYYRLNAFEISYYSVLSYELQ